MSEIDNNTLGQKPHTGILAAASVVLSILAILRCNTVNPQNRGRTKPPGLPHSRDTKV
ncbi:MAG: hypothetical protein HQ580_13095 [Planctomycetes bacterium]|nr:hypothetical protein [Planctomycetota bacterium]